MTKKKKVFTFTAKKNVVDLKNSPKSSKSQVTNFVNRSIKKVAQFRLVNGPNFYARTRPEPEKATPNPAEAEHNHKIYFKPESGAIIFDLANILAIRQPRFLFS